jgi:uncharacterized protein YdaT
MTYVEKEYEGTEQLKPKSEKSLELYNVLLKKGYPEPFCDEITKNLNTDWTAQRMMYKR